MDEVDTLNPDPILHFLSTGGEWGKVIRWACLFSRGYGHLSYLCFTTENGDIYNTRVQLNLALAEQLENAGDSI